MLCRPDFPWAELPTVWNAFLKCTKCQVAGILHSSNTRSKVTFLPQPLSVLHKKKTRGAGTPNTIATNPMRLESQPYPRFWNKCMGRKWKTESGEGAEEGRGCRCRGGIADVSVNDIHLDALIWNHTATSKQCGTNLNTVTNPEHLAAGDGNRTHV
jgi:hypothetical protein